MAYQLHIKRHSPIEFEEWIDAINITDGVRLNEDDFVAVNPSTNEEIRISSGRGSAEIYINSANNWQRVYRYHEHRISFNATEEWAQAESDIRNYTFKLAAKLEAKICGDEGEEYSKNKGSTLQSKKWWQFW
jgi:hypothetical protein